MRGRYLGSGRIEYPPTPEGRATATNDPRSRSVRELGPAVHPDSRKLSDPRRHSNHDRAQRRSRKRALESALSGEFIQVASRTRGPLSLPLVFAAEQGLVFFQLSFNVTECVLASSQHIFSTADRVKRSRRQRQRQCQNLLIRSMIFRKNAVQLDQIRFITLEQFTELIQPVSYFRCYRFLRVHMLVAEGYVHVCTCREFTD